MPNPFDSLHKDQKEFRTFIDRLMGKVEAGEERPFKIMNNEYAEFRNLDSLVQDLVDAQFDGLEYHGHSALIRKVVYLTVAVVLFYQQKINKSKGEQNVTA